MRTKHLAVIILSTAILLSGMYSLASAEEVGVSITGPQAPPTVDSYVLLDSAKLLLGEGRLEQARDRLADIPVDEDEPFINEELSLQRLLVASAFLGASHQVRRQLEGIGEADSEYGLWLRKERSKYLKTFLQYADQYLTQTADGAELDFVRFRLPYVSNDHLYDLELYSDPEVLDPAVTNWADGRDGLGRGLVLVQARVALVLAAAVHYDMDHAQTSLDDVSERLRCGVPIDLATTLDWLADLSVRLATPDDGLVALARRCDERIEELTAGDFQNPARERMQLRIATNYQMVSEMPSPAGTSEPGETEQDPSPDGDQPELLADKVSKLQKEDQSTSDEPNTTEARTSE